MAKKDETPEKAESDKTDARLGQLRSLVFILFAAVFVMFLWLWWMTARMHHTDARDYHRQSQMMRGGWSSGDMNSGDTWQFR